MTWNWYSDFFFAKNRGTENAYFYAVEEEVKQWKNTEHWTTQTFSAKLLVNLCGLKIFRSSFPFPIPCNDLSLSEAMLLTQYGIHQHSEPLPADSWDDAVTHGQGHMSDRSQGN